MQTREAAARKTNLERAVCAACFGIRALFWQACLTILKASGRYSTPEVVQDHTLYLARSHNPILPCPFVSVWPLDRIEKYESQLGLFEGSLEVKLPTIWTDEKQSREEAERKKKD